MSAVVGAAHFAREGWGGKTVPVLYLDCLLSPEQLEDAKITSVPHGQNTKVYSDLLRGIAFKTPLSVQDMLGSDVQDLADAAPQKRQRRGPHTAEGMGVSGGDVSTSAADPWFRADDDGADDDGEELMLLDALDEAVDAGLLAQAMQLPDQSTGHDVQHGAPSGSGSASEPVFSPAAPGPLAPPPLAQAAGSRQPRASKQARPGQNQPWGQFSIIKKGNGYQATCPYHKGTDTAPACKHFISFNPNDPTAATQCLNKLMLWCLAAPEWNRKRAHLKLRATESQLAGVTFEALEEIRNVLPAPPAASDLIPDHVLDAMEEEAEQEAPPGRGNPAATPASSGSTSSSSSSD